MISSSFTELMTDIIVVDTALYKHRSVIKHAINKTKMRPGPKIEHYHMIAMLFKIQWACSQSETLPLRSYTQHHLHYTIHSIHCSAVSRFQRSRLPIVKYHHRPERSSNEIRILETKFEFRKKTNLTSLLWITGCSFWKLVTGFKTGNWVPDSHLTSSITTSFTIPYQST